MIQLFVILFVILYLLFFTAVGRMVVAMTINPYWRHHYAFRRLWNKVNPKHKIK